MNKTYAFFALVLLLYGCQSNKQEQVQTAEKVNSDVPLTTIAFGSCSHEYDEDQLWDEISLNKPQLWIWLGDNIYGDSFYMNVLKEKYNRQKSRPSYQKFLASPVNIIGTWDDHDFGINDGGKYYSMKDESKDLMLEFLDVPEDHPVRQRKGAYQSYTYGSGLKKVKVILLDTRYFRDSLHIEYPYNKRTYVPNTEGDILGEDQWTWLSSELTDSDAAIHIIGSSIQVFSEEHRYEKWSNFPNARKRLFELLAEKKPSRVLFLSGDRHIAEISQLEIPDYLYPVYDFTSSGLTHTWNSYNVEPNKYRISDFIIAKNFGLIKILWNSEGPEVTLQIMGKHNVLLDDHTLDW